jgi:hypothetical protein
MIFVLNVNGVKLSLVRFLRGEANFGVMASRTAWSRPYLAMFAQLICITTPATAESQLRFSQQRNGS